MSKMSSQGRYYLRADQLTSLGISLCLLLEELEFSLGLKLKALLFLRKLDLVVILLLLNHLG